MAQQLSFDDYTSRQAVQARDAGMIEAEFAEVLSGSSYCDALYAAICYVARRQCEVHADDVLPLVKVKPLHPNAAGSVWRRAMKDGVLLGEVGRRRCATDVVKKAHVYPVYRSGVFHGRRA
ncbi:hypothetical protein [Bradyrhizobium sp. CCH5-F6]|uniref:hypothetical protein n=1 Tax=Bradyrhizobium sp. CCH5-F6 TaxID=1768753 RepID=UPI000769B4AF|nr:hypothetical protein [Bradyrhizobium sp. CCH5-F6]